MFKIFPQRGTVDFKRGNAGRAPEQVKQARYVSPVDLARLYARLGEKDRAMEWLEKAYDERAGTISEIKVEPAWDSLRPDARFTDLLRRIGLTQ